MPSDGEPSKNPFVRFKEHVDAHIGTGLNNVANLPSILSDSIVNPRQPTPANSKAVSNGQDYIHDTQSSHEDAVFASWLQQRGRAIAHENDLDDQYYYAMQASRESTKEYYWYQRFNRFAAESYYSPLLLSLQHPRQPCPRDIHSDMDPRLFTFVDAFEDLLAEAAGKPKIDLRARYNMNRGLRFILGPGESQYWTRRLDSQGLIKAYWPYDRPGLSKQHAVQKPNGLDEKHRDRPADKAWHDADVDPARPAGRVWHDADGGPAADERPNAETGLFGEIEKVVKALNQVLDNGLTASSVFRTEKDEEPARQEPRLEDDLYNAVQSAFTEAQQSLGTFFKFFSEGRLGIDRRPNDKADSQTGAPIGETVEDESGAKTVRSVKEYIDDWGNKHVKTEITKTTRNGKMTEVRYEVRPASEAELSAVEDSQQHQGESANQEWPVSDEKRDGDKASGWFWK